MLHKLKKAADDHAIGLMMSPFTLLFILFLVIPVVAAILLSFTYFNTIEPPKFTGLTNYISLFTKDAAFLQQVLPNTIIFAVFVGAGGYALSFLMAWSLAQIPKKPRTALALVLYSPSMVSGVMMTTVWQVLFNGDKTGYLNTILLQLGWIDQPKQWLTSSSTLLTIMILVSLWSSMGVGFLAMMAGILSVNRELYEAAHIDGVRNRFQEIMYVTIPTVRPQMLFGAIMAVVNTFQNGSIGVQLSGSNPTPNNSGQLIVAHIEDYGFYRYEMGYATAVAVILLLMIWGLSSFARRLFTEKDEEAEV